MDEAAGLRPDHYLSRLWQARGSANRGKTLRVGQHNGRWITAVVNQTSCWCEHTLSTPRSRAISEMPHAVVALSLSLATCSSVFLRLSSGFRPVLSAEFARPPFLCHSETNPQKG